MGLSYKEALQRAMNLCSRSEKSASDIIDSLTRWGIESSDERDKILQELKRNKFIDELRFTKAYVRDKHRFNRWGKIKLRAMLRAKNIADNNILEALETIDDEEYFSILRDEISKKRDSIKASNLFDLKGRLMRFAHSRGFETDLIFKAIDQVLSD